MSYLLNNWKHTETSYIIDTGLKEKKIGICTLESGEGAPQREGHPFPGNLDRLLRTLLQSSRPQVSVVNNRGNEQAMFCICICLCGFRSSCPHLNFWTEPRNVVRYLVTIFKSLSCKIFNYFSVCPFDLLMLWTLAISLVDPDPVGSEIICRIRTRIRNY